MTPVESASIALYEGVSLDEYRGGVPHPPKYRSHSRFWLVVMIEVLLLMTILGIFWCQAASNSHTAPEPKEIIPPPLGNVVAWGIL